MIACLYGQAVAPFVAPVVHDLCAAAAAAGGEIQPRTIEAAVTAPARCADVHRLYVLPFDLPATAAPLSAGAGTSPASLIRTLFPGAELVTSFAVQDLCWDTLATAERLLDRGVPVPETMFTSEPSDVHAFVQEHGFAILKERFSCGGRGDLVVWLEDGQLVGDSGTQQYRIELAPAGTRRLSGHCLRYPAPFYVQRLVADVGPRGVRPGQVLRAYVVDNRIVFWSERYRNRYVRPADWIVPVGSGTKYRFAFSASEEAEKLALRSAAVTGLRAGVVDVARAGGGGPYVLAVGTDSYHMVIDRHFKQLPEYREFFDLDRYIAEALLVDPEPPRSPVRTAGLLGA